MSPGYYSSGLEFVTTARLASTGLEVMTVSLLSSWAISAHHQHPLWKVTRPEISKMFSTRFVYSMTRNRTFMAEFTNLLAAQLTGNPNSTMERPEIKTRDSDILHATNLRQHFRIRHTIGNILDLVITPSSGSVVTSVTVLTDHHVVTSVTVESLLTDHHAVHCLLQAPKPDRTKKQISYHKYAAINSTKFR